MSGEREASSGTEATRPRFTVARVAEDGRLSFARVAEFAEAVLGCTMTPEELARARAWWRERFPDDPAAQEPPVTDPGGPVR